MSGLMRISDLSALTFGCADKTGDSFAAVIEGGFKALEICLDGGSLIIL